MKDIEKLTKSDMIFWQQIINGSYIYGLAELTATALKATTPAACDKVIVSTLALGRQVKNCRQLLEGLSIE